MIRSRAYLLYCLFQPAIVNGGFSFANVSARGPVMNQQRITGRLICFLTICFLAGCSEADLVTGEVVTPQDKEVFARVLEQKTQRIKTEIRQLGPDHPWAGLYEANGVFESTSLLMAPRNGFMVKHDTCNEIGIGYGTVEEDGAVLRLNLAAFSDHRSNLLKRFQQLQCTVPTWWGPRQYLVSEFDLDRFKRTVLKEPRKDAKMKMEPYLHRGGDWHVTGARATIQSK
jgi:hypothetical protein